MIEWIVAVIIVLIIVLFVAIGGYLLFKLAQVAFYWLRRKAKEEKDIHKRGDYPR